MSLIQAHLRILRAEADAIEEEAEHLKLEAPADNAVLYRGLCALVRAKRTAADRLHKEEIAALERANGRPV